MAVRIRRVRGASARHAALADGGTWRRTGRRRTPAPRLSPRASIRIVTADTAVKADKRRRAVGCRFFAERQYPRGRQPSTTTEPGTGRLARPYGSKMLNALRCGQVLTANGLPCKGLFSCLRRCHIDGQDRRASAIPSSETTPMAEVARVVEPRHGTQLPAEHRCHDTRPLLVKAHKIPVRHRQIAAERS